RAPSQPTRRWGCRKRITGSSKSSSRASASTNNSAVEHVLADAGDLAALLRPVGLHVRGVVVRHALHGGRAALVVHVLGHPHRALPGRALGLLDVAQAGPREGLALEHDLADRL